MPGYEQDLDAVENYPKVTASQDGRPEQNGTDKVNGHSNDRPAPFKVCYDEVLGRHLVATRDIMPGEAILQEAPLVTGPPLDFHACCVSCYKHLDEENHLTCSKGCGWPVCSEKCAKSPTHQPECDITCNMRKEKVSINVWNEPSPLFECLIVLRCLTLRDLNPSLWMKLSKLEAHIAKRQGTKEWERERDSIANCLKEYFKLDYPEPDIHKICGVIQVNGYTIPLTEPPHIALYDQLSFMEHDCIPNCSKVWDSSCSLTLHTASFVPRGQHLSICYTNPLWGTAMRRNHLAQELLLCKCTRCSDPSECGTYFSALCCNQHSCDGHLLPEDPVPDAISSVLHSRFAGSTRWQCSKCEAKLSSQQVEMLLAEVKKKLHSLEKTDITACMKFLEEESKLLHKNHFYLTEVKILLAKLIGQRPTSMEEVSDHLLQLKISLCKDVLSLANIIFPAVHQVTGLIRFELYRAMKEASLRNHAQSGKDLVPLPGTLDDILNEAIFILRCEPAIVPELFNETLQSDNIF